MATKVSFEFRKETGTTETVKVLMDIFRMNGVSGITPQGNGVTYDVDFDNNNDRTYIGWQIAQYPAVLSVTITPEGFREQDTPTTSQPGEEYRP